MQSNFAWLLFLLYRCTRIQQITLTDAALRHKAHDCLCSPHCTSLWGARHAYSPIQRRALNDWRTIRLWKRRTQDTNHAAE